MRDGKELVEAGYYQTSSKYRMVGRVPPGKTAKDALYEKQMESVLKNVAALRKEKKLPVSSVFRTPDDMERYWREEYRRWVDRLGELNCVDQYIRVYARGDDSLTLTPDEWRSFKAAGGRCAR